MASAQRLYINNTLNLVGYPNRDSNKYLKLYGIPEAKSIIRGTIRFQGYVETISALNDLGLLDEKTLIKDKFFVPFEHIKNQIKDESSKPDLLNQSQFDQILTQFSQFAQFMDLGKLINKFTKSHFL